MTNGRRRTFFKIDLQIVRSMWRECVGLLLVENISEVMIFFRHRREVRNVVGYRGRFGGYERVRQSDLEHLRTIKFASKHESCWANDRNWRGGNGRRCRNTRGSRQNC